MSDLAQNRRNDTRSNSIILIEVWEKNNGLPDDVIVYPAHGAGSACGKNLSKETVGTIGEQKEINHALRADMTKEEFIQEVLDGLLPPPAYRT
jgi:glyoxylase-like metal-dependent hydrolase (beta-lactamase superfamily II)